MFGRVTATALFVALSATSVAHAEGTISIAQQFGIGYLILDVVPDQHLIEKHGKKGWILKWSGARFQAQPR